MADVFKWVRFSAINGNILGDLTVSSDRIKKDINGYDDIELTVPAYTLKNADRLSWAEKHFQTWAIGVALINVTKQTCEAAGIIARRDFSGDSEELRVTAYNLSEYLKKVRSTARYATIKTKGEVTVSGASWGEVYAEIVRQGFSTQGAPADIKFPEAVILPPKTGSGKTHKIDIVNQSSVFEELNNLRDSYDTNGEEWKFSPKLQANKIYWELRTGTAATPHMNTGGAITKISTRGTSGPASNPWKVSDLSVDDNGTLQYNRLLISGSQDEEAPFVGVGGKTAAGQLTLTEVFNANTELTQAQMTAQLNARLKASMFTDKDISIEIVDDNDHFFFRKVGVNVAIYPGAKTAGVATTGRVTELVYSSTKPDCVTLTVSRSAARYPKLPSNKDTSGATGGFKDKNADLKDGGFSPFNPDGLDPFDPSLDPGLGGIGDIFPGDADGDWGAGGDTPTVAISGMAYDMYNAPFPEVIIKAYLDSGLTELAYETLTGDTGEYVLNVGENTKYWLVASYYSTVVESKNNPIEVEAESIDNVNFSLPTSNPLALSKVYGRLTNAFNRDGSPKAVFVVPFGEPANFGVRISFDEDGFFTTYLPAGIHQLFCPVTNADTRSEGFDVQASDTDIGDFFLRATTNRLNEKPDGISVEVTLLGKRTGMQEVRLEGYADPEMEELITVGATNIVGSAFLTFPEHYTSEALYIKAVSGSYSGAVFAKGAYNDYARITLSSGPKVTIHGEIPAGKTWTKVFLTMGQWLTNDFSTARQHFSAVDTETRTFWMRVPRGFYSVGVEVARQQGTPLNAWVMPFEANSDRNLGTIYPIHEPAASGDGLFAKQIYVRVGNLTAANVEGVITKAYTDSTKAFQVGEARGPGGVLILDSGRSYTDVFYETEYRGVKTSTTQSFTNSTPITLTIPTPTFTVSGTITDHSGTPRSGIRVEIFAGVNRQRLNFANTTADGKYSFTVPVGTWTLSGHKNISEQIEVVDKNIVVDGVRDNAGTLTEVAFARIDQTSTLPGKVSIYSDAGYSQKIGEYTIENSVSTAGIIEAGLTARVLYQAKVSIDRTVYPRLYLETFFENERRRAATKLIPAAGLSQPITNVETYTLSGKVYTAAGAAATSGTVGITSNGQQLTDFDAPAINPDGTFSTQVPIGHWVLSVNEALQTEVEIKDKDVAVDVHQTAAALRNFSILPKLGGIAISTNVILHETPAYAGILSERRSSRKEQFYRLDAATYSKLHIELERGGVSLKETVNTASMPTAVPYYMSFAKIFKISGTLLEEGTDLPVTGGTVSVGITGANASLFSVVPDADGNFEFNLPPGKYHVFQTGAGENWGIQRERKFIEVKDKDISGVALKYVKAGRMLIEGTAKLTGGLFTQNWQGEVQFSYAADFAEIAHSIKLNQGDSATLSWSWKGAPANTQIYVRAKYEGLNYPHSSPVQGAASSRQTVNILIDRQTYEVTGRMQNTSGDPVGSGQKVSIYTNPNRNGAVMQSTTVNAGGVWTAQLPAGKYYAFSQDNAYRTIAPIEIKSESVVAPILVVNPGMQNIRVELSSGGRPAQPVKIVAENKQGEAVWETETFSLSGNTVSTLNPWRALTVKIITEKKTFVYSVLRDVTTQQTITLDLPSL